MFVFIEYPRFFSLPRKQHEMKIKKKNFVLLKKKRDDQTYDIVHLSYEKILTQKRHISMSNAWELFRLCHVLKIRRNAFMTIKKSI